MVVGWSQGLSERMVTALKFLVEFHRERGELEAAAKYCSRMLECGGAEVSLLSQLHRHHGTGLLTPCPHPSLRSNFCKSGASAHVCLELVAQHACLGVGGPCARMLQEEWAKEVLKLIRDQFRQ